MMMAVFMDGPPCPGRRDGNRKKGSLDDFREQGKASHGAGVARGARHGL